MSAVIRIKEILHRRQRTQKLRKLRDRYSKAKTESEKTLIIQKVGRIAIWLTEEEFLKPLKDRNALPN